MENGNKKCLYIVSFGLTRRLRVRGKNAWFFVVVVVVLHPVAQATIYCLLPDTF